MYLSFSILIGFAFLYSIFIGRVDRLPFSGPIISIGFGIAVGPLGLGWLDMNITGQELKILADLTLAMVLFCDAANANRAVVQSKPGISLRLLFIGLPLSICFGTLAARFVFEGIAWWDLAVLATMLAATDAALGKGVITNKLVPVHIRESLNLESGLNDGICVPILLVFITLAEANGQVADVGQVVAGLLIREIGVGMLTGITVVLVGYWLAVYSTKMNWNNRAWDRVQLSLAAILCFTLAQTLGGSGYIAAFVGGLALSWITRLQADGSILDAEGTGEVLGVVTWVLFGSAVLGVVVEHLTWSMFVYALLSLTVIRMIPVLVSLIGSGERLSSRLFIAWFGPRGLASIVFAVMVANSEVQGRELLVVVVALTVALSALVHGVSANPLAARLGRASAKN